MTKRRREAEFIDGEILELSLEKNGSITNIRILLWRSHDLINDMIYQLNSKIWLGFRYK